jgi:hypothetical protein
MWLQHLLVLLLTAGSMAFVLWQLWRTFYGRRSALGQCCARGCSAGSATSGTQRIVFLPSEALRRRRR